MIKILKEETLNDLENLFNFETELGDILPEKAPHVEVVNLDLIRIYIYDRIHPEDIKDAIFNILHQNDEAGPLSLHVETASSCRMTLYADIKTI